MKDHPSPAMIDVVMLKRKMSHSFVRRTSSGRDRPGGTGGRDVDLNRGPGEAAGASSCRLRRDVKLRHTSGGEIVLPSPVLREFF
jgi:hypothetical protein